MENSGSWDLDRMGLFKIEITKMFLAYNKPAQKNMIDSKAELTAETLKNLKTNQIQSFFSFVRETEGTLPTDGALKQIYVRNLLKFEPLKPQIEDFSMTSSDYPDEAWMREFTIRAGKVIAGIMSPEQAKRELGIILVQDDFFYT